jgi:hypothetical protein
MIFQLSEKIIINSSAEKIWDFANNPVNWTASNPIEHKGLEFHNSSNRPETGVIFYQKESLAGIYADLKGLIQYAQRPNVCVWTGLASYKLLGGLLRTRIPEGGTVTLVKVDKGYEMKHAVFMHFPDSLLGKVMFWYFIKVLDGEKALRLHAGRELEYFKRELKA